MRPSTTVLRRVLLASRIVVATVSGAVLALTALAWHQLGVLDRSTPVAPVIQGPTHPVAAEQNILLVGLDTRTDAQGNPLPVGLLDALHAGSPSDGGDTTDSLIVVHVPAGGGRTTAISIPRDTYVDLGGGLGRHKINSAYARAYRDTVDQMTGGRVGVDGGVGTRPVAAGRIDPAVARQAAAAGARATIASVEGLTGLRIDHYAAVNLAGFADLSQAIGGVPICLREPAEDPYSGTMMPAGPQTVAGTRALAFVRQRHGLPNGDLDRIARQQEFLAGATSRVLPTGMLANPFAMARLSAAVSRSVTLDAGWDVLGFVRQLQGLSARAVTFRTIPTGTTTLATPDDGAAVAVSPSAVRAFVANAVAADAGGPATAASTPPAPRHPGTVPTPVASTRSAGPGPVSHPPEGVRQSGPVVPPPITAAQPGCVN